MALVKRLLKMSLGLGVVGVIGGGVYLWYTDPTRLPAPVLNTIEALQVAVPAIPQRIAEQVAQFTQPTAKENAGTPAPKVTEHQVTLYLRNGGIVTGELVERTAEAITLRWDYGEVTFQSNEIARVVEGRQVEGEQDVVLPKVEEVRWPYRHDVVFRLMNGTILDTALRGVRDGQLEFVQTLEGGGVVEQVVPVKDLDQVMFRPVVNERSEQIRKTLETVFPAMRWEEEGLFTLVTDSIPPTVKGYRQTIREVSTDWYLTFYPLLKDRGPMTQQYIVIFENWDAYIEYAATDGVPGWMAVGYFHPEDEVLYCFNMVGERFADLLYEVFLGSSRRAVDGAVDQIKGMIDARYEVFLEGLGADVKKKVETAYARLRQSYAQITTDTVRHELTHAMFHNWKLQSVILSTMPEQDTERAQKKRAYLQATDVEQKRELLVGLLSQAAEADTPELQATNSWFVEGLAAYMEPSPAGSTTTEWLPTAQEALRSQQLLPLEFLNVFRMGSFPHMANQAKLYAYGQSWAFVNFLMHRYPTGFLAYLDRMAVEHPAEGEDLAWLLEAVGRELRPLEDEFKTYLEQLPPEDPPWMQRKQILLDLRESLRNF